MSRRSDKEEYLAAQAASFIKKPLPKSTEELRREYRRLFNFIDRNGIAVVRHNGDGRKPEGLTLREAEKKVLLTRCLVFRDVLKQFSKGKRDELCLRR